MITLITGNDWKSASAFVRARSSAFERTFIGSMCSRIDVREVDEQEAIGGLQSQQLWGGSQCIIFAHIEANNPLLSYIEERARELNESQDVYMLWCDMTKKDIAAYKTLARFSEIHDFSAQSENEIPQQELYAFSDMVATGRRREAFARFHQLTRRGMPAERIFHSLRSHAENLAIVGVLQKSGKSASEIATQTKLHPYVVEKCITQLCTKPANQRLGEALLRFDMELKRGLVVFPEGFEEVLLG